MNLIEFGDNRETMKQWAAQGVKVQMCVTSPPYFGLRDYGTAKWTGGTDPTCEHIKDATKTKKFGNPEFNDNRPSREDTKTAGYYFDNVCDHCGATKEDGQLGQEETPEEFIANMVDVFRHVKDILADDGVIWVNMGDSYAGSGKGRNGDGSVNLDPNSKQATHAGTTMGKLLKSKTPDCKPKDLIGIPWMLAFALRADGWYLRQDIIWNKPNPMPESVRDRCTKSHEYIFLLSKSQKYFFDNEAIKEPVAASTVGRLSQPKLDEQTGSERVPGKTNGNMKAVGGLDTRNKRSVWTVTTKPYKGAHFATYPPELITPCILSSTSEKGHCPECGSRWVREVERTRVKRNELDPSDPRYRPNSYNGEYADINGKGDAGYTATKTLGWKPTCECGHDPVPDVVLDPFMGSGTTAAVAAEHGRQYMGCELNVEYGALQEERIAPALAKATVNSLFETDDEESTVSTDEEQTPQ